MKSVEKQYTSRHGEDGIIDSIFQRIGTTNRFFVEFGVDDGLHCNTTYLARKKHWDGLMMEGSAIRYPRLAKNYRRFRNVRVENSFITAENITSLFAKYLVPREFDLLSIGIDGNEFWVWQALRSYRARVVVVEYNAAYPPPASLTIRYDAGFRWNHTTAYGASLSALTKLGAMLGYALVGTDRSGVNAFFVLAEALPASGLSAISPSIGFNAARYGLLHPPHPYGPGDFVEI